MKSLCLLLLWLGIVSFQTVSDEGEQTKEELQLKAYLEVPMSVEDPPVCEGCTAGELGSECEALEESVILRVRLKWVGWSALQRSQGVVEVGKLSLRHAHPGTARVADRLVQFLNQSESSLVSLAAVVSLGLRQETSIAVPTLTHSSQTIGGRIPKLSSKYSELQLECYSLAMLEFGRRTGADIPRADSKERKRRKQANKELVEVGKELRGAYAVQLAGLASLANYKEDRCTKALVQLVKGLPESMEESGFDYSLKAYLRNGTRPCIKAAVKRLKSLEDHYKQFDETIKKLRKERPKPAPKNWKGTKKGWKERFKTSQQGKVQTAEEERAVWVLRMERHHATMTSFAESKGLQAPKFEPGKLSIFWGRWLTRNAKELPGSFDQK